MSDASDFYSCLYLQVELSWCTLHFVLPAVWDGQFTSGPYFTMTRRCTTWPPKDFFWEKKLSWQWLILLVFSVKFVCLFWVYQGRKTKYFWSHKNLNQKSSAQGLCSSPASVVISCCLFHLDCFSFKLFLLWTLQKARNGCFRILFSVLLYNTHW